MNILRKAITPLEGDYLCSGIPASGGRAAGVARVILSESAMDSLAPGEVLVCRFTHPTIVPALRTIAALVTDVGGALSHAAIIAREMGVPAVTGCGDATAVIETEERVQVDGDLGLVMSADHIQ